MCLPRLTFAVLVLAATVGAAAAEPRLHDDPGLQHALERARQEFLERQSFDRVHVTALVEASPGRWNRASVGGDELHYPASCVKLPFMVAAVARCRERGLAPDCLDSAVRPMVVDSDNVATGTVVDAVTGTINQPDDAPGLEDWIVQRQYTERLLDGAGLLGTQRMFTKTYPTNSGEEPAGFEALARARLGRNAMAPDPAARLMLAVQDASLEPQARHYMRTLLRRPAFSPQSSLGGGLPPGSLHESKIGTAYDTLGDIMYAQLPNGVRLIMAAFTNAYDGAEPQPWDAARLGHLAGLFIRHAQLDRGLPPSRQLSAMDDAPSGREGRWLHATHRSALNDAGYLRSDGSPEARLRWTLAVEKSGRHSLAVWYPAAADQAARAVFTVQHARGRTVVTLDQSTWGARWLPLGDFDFDARGGSVTLDAPEGGILAADTLRVTRWAPSASPSSPPQGLDP